MQTVLLWQAEADSEAAAKKAAQDAEVTMGVMRKLKAAAATAATAAATATSTALKARHDAAVAGIAAELAAARRESARVSSELESANLRVSSAEARAAEFAQKLDGAATLLESAQIARNAAAADSEACRASLAELNAQNGSLTEKLKLKQLQCDALDLDVSRMQVDAAEATRRASELEQMVDSLSAKIADMEWEQERLLASAQSAKIALGRSNSVTAANDGANSRV
jgi:chromosome segregation ATPase